MSQTNSEYPSMPTPQEFLLETPVHRLFRNDNVTKLRDFKEPLDFYCPECGKHSIFNRSDDTPSQIMARTASGSRLYYREPEFFSMHYKCSRYDHHEAVFYFREGKDSICKIGEYPSKATAFSSDIEKYKKFLGREQMNLQLAQELYSQGIGAGSFVYLRRIFENVILERVATRKYKDVKDWSFQEWKKSNKRMEDKLKDIADVLPSFINHHELFNVLSVGVHSLDEETCLQYFPIIKAAIIEILDAEILEENKEKNRLLLGKEVSKINRDVRKQ